MDEYSTTSKQTSMKTKKVFNNSKPKNMEEWKIQTLKEWILDNVQNPYPSKFQKLKFRTNLNLTQRQIENWFINLRRVSMLSVTLLVGIQYPSRMILDFRSSYRCYR